MKKNKYHTLLNKWGTAELVWTVILAVTALCVTCFPLRLPGLYGYEPDILYHLNRIEGVKAALAEHRYPAAIYTNFFDGQGYGSPLFYPDLLLVIPAVLRLMGMSVTVAYKATVALFSVLLALVTKYSLKLFCKRWELAVAGAALFSMSQFVLADIIVRAGFSSYLSYIFLPLLVSGLWDLFAGDGRHIHLLGISLGGLVLTHTLNAFQGILTAASVSVIMLLSKDGRRTVADKDRMIKLGLTALASVLITAWYWMPMLEQMTSGVDFVYRHPWADVGEFTQLWEDFFALTGYFFNIAHVGIGVPILMFIAVRLFSGKPADADGRFGDLCYFWGIAMIIAMTDIVPWKVLSHTIMNQLQFTFRIYPFALIFLTFGIVSSFDRLLAGRDRKEYRVRTSVILMIAVTALSAVFGIVQNRTVSTADPEAFHEMNETVLRERDNEVGRGEWLPYAYDREAEIIGEKEENGITMPERIYYKGYRARIAGADGKKVWLDVTEGEDGLVSIADTHGLTGEAELIYRRTPCQILSLIISILTLLALIYLQTCVRLKGHGRQMRRPVSR